MRGTRQEMPSEVECRIASVLKNKDKLHLLRRAVLRLTTFPHGLYSIGIAKIHFLTWCGAYIFCFTTKPLVHS